MGMMNDVVIKKLSVSPVRRALLLGSLVILAACADAEQPLSAVKLAALEIEMQQTQLTLQLDPGLKPPCPLFGKVTATQDGVPLEQLAPGGRTVDGQGILPGLYIPVGGTEVCSWPAWRGLPVSAIAPSTTFVVDDGKTKLTMEVQNMAPGRPIFTLTTPTNGVVHPGDHVDIDWTPATDQLVAREFELHFSIGNFGGATVLGLHSDGQGGDVPPSNDLVVAGQRASFTVPDAVQFDGFGAGELSAGGDGIHGVARCEGVPTCTPRFTLFPAATMPITVLR